MPKFRYQIGTLDLGIVECDLLSIHIEHQAVMLRLHQLADQLAASVPELVQTDAHAPTEKAPEVFGTHQWPVQTRRRHLQRVTAGYGILDVQHPGHTVADLLTVIQRDAAWRIDINAQYGTPALDVLDIHQLEAEALATEMREAETRRAAVLARARELALSDDQTIVRTLGDAKTRGVGRGTGEETETSKGANNLLDGAPRTVSKATDLLAAHVDDALQSATELDPHAHRASASLAAAAADCLDLFRACVIAARGEQLKTIHAASLVFYNDCHHLANRFSASLFARGVALERQIGRTPALIWPVEPLRALGDATRAEANNRVLRELHAALDVASGFLRSAEVQVKEDIVKSIARARHVIHRVGTTSMYVLPDPIGTQDAAELALHYARRVTLEILSMEDISVEESEALTEIIGVAFASEGLVGKKGDEDAIRALLRAVGPEWQKVRELGVMLSAPLRDIATSWERGSLQKVGFTASEVRGFIGALFSETPLRAECLARIG